MWFHFKQVTYALFQKNIIGIINIKYLLKGKINATKGKEWSVGHKYIMFSHDEHRWHPRTFQNFESTLDDSKHREYQQKWPGNPEHLWSKMIKVNEK